MHLEASQSQGYNNNRRNDTWNGKVRCVRFICKDSNCFAWKKTFLHDYINLLLLIIYLKTQDCHTFVKSTLVVAFEQRIINQLIGYNSHTVNINQGTSAICTELI